MAEKAANWGKFGGNGKMHGNTGVGAQSPGVSSQEGSGGKNPAEKISGGPSSAGFYSPSTTNKDYAGTQKPGVSASDKAGGNAKWAEGGKTAMFGNRGSLPAKPGCSAP